MGAFLLLHHQFSDAVRNARELFDQKGFKAPDTYTLGEWQLLLYPKLTHNSPQAYLDGEDGIFAVGTFIYKEENFENSRRILLADAQNGDIQLEQLLGHYTILLYVKKRLTILSDPLDTKHIFANKKYTVFSSSLMALAAMEEHPPTINREAFFEKCLTGLILSPDTIYSEVVQLNRGVRTEILKEQPSLAFLQAPLDRKAPSPHSDGRTKSARCQADALIQYLTKWKSAAADERVDFGLSGGYDSTLLYAASLPVFGDTLHIHTHSTGHVHDREKAAAMKMCELKGKPCAVVETKRFDEMDAAPDAILRQNLMFFDGRTSFSIGGFSPTYCAEYRIKATDGCSLTMTGVGGEVYRNNFSLSPSRRKKCEAFFRDCVFNPFFSAAVKDQSVMRRISEYHLHKAEKLLGCSLHGRIDHLWLRRYYSEVMMPEGQGHVLDAYNTVSHCIAPFMEPALLREGYKGIAYLGNAGEYEGEIIRVIDPALADCISSYGFAFSRIPLKQRVKQAIRARIPGLWWEKLAMLKGRSGASSDRAYFNRVAERCAMLKEAVETLAAQFPDIDLYEMMKGPSMTACLSYIAMLMQYSLINDEVARQ